MGDPRGHRHRVAVIAVVFSAGLNLLGLLTRVRPDDEEFAPALRPEHRLQPWSAGVCVPLFAFFAAGVPIGPSAPRGVSGDPVPPAVIAGLSPGKVVGIPGASWLAIR